MIRSLLEKTLRHFSFKRSLPKKFGGGGMYVSTTGGLRYMFKSMDSIDPVLFSLVDEYIKSGMKVWDIGANLGIFSLTAANRVGVNGFVLAVEPDVELIPLLRKSFQLQNDMPLNIILPAAISNENNLLKLCVSNRASSSNYLEGYGTSQAGGISSCQHVISCSLDWLAELVPLPDLIKIDVEGAEVSVLKGASQVLSNSRPIVLCEVEQRNSEEIYQLFSDYGYLLYDGEIIHKERKPLNFAPWSTIAIPK